MLHSDSASEFLHWDSVAILAEALNLQGDFVVSVVMITLLFLVVQASAHKPVANHVAQTHEFTHMFVGKLVERLSEQSLQLWPLDNTVL